MVHHVFLDPRLVKTSIAPEPVRLGAIVVERMTGFEPATSTLARLRSSQLSYIRGNASLYQA
ncbi:uncharacterized protein METZ01_LOCUS588 [marine metagenome]|uniref:Uncharacterized protein n=1 Tax=marine metagenome TaxID=408172 RepID=A0A381N115_9ZZZZ